MHLKSAHLTLVIQFFKFGVIGILGFCVDYTVLHLAITEAHLNPYQAALVSFPFAVTSTWIGNRYFTFRGKGRDHLAKEWAKFFVVCTVGLVFNRGTYSALVYWIPFFHDHLIIALMGGTLCGMFFNFFLARSFVFR